MLIGLGHYSRVGKDTFADMLVKHLQQRNLSAAKIPFARKLKQICHELYAWAGMRDPDFYDTAEGAPLRDVVLPGIGKTPVKIWVEMGTPAVREIVYDRTWIDYLLRSQHHLDVLVIPDVRFRNETEAIREAGGLLIKIVRPGIEPRNTVADQALIGWNGWDRIIVNHTLEDLEWYAWSVAGEANL